MMLLHNQSRSLSRILVVCLPTKYTVCISQLYLLPSCYMFRPQLAILKDT